MDLFFEICQIIQDKETFTIHPQSIPIPTPGLTYPVSIMHFFPYGFIPHTNTHTRIYVSIDKWTDVVLLLFLFFLTLSFYQTWMVLSRLFYSVFFFWCSIDIVFNSWIISHRLDVLCLFNLLIIDRH